MNPFDTTDLILAITSGLAIALISKPLHNYLNFPKKMESIEFKMLYATHEAEILHILEERKRQIAKFGNQENKPLYKLFPILAEEFGEVAKEVNEIINADEKHLKANPEAYYKELTQLVAVGLQLMQIHNSAHPEYLSLQCPI